MAKWRQHILTRQTKAGRTEVLVCWLEVDKYIKEGSIISLKGQLKRWKVEKIFDKIRLDNPPRQDWKVGGIWR